VNAAKPRPYFTYIFSGAALLGLMIYLHFNADRYRQLLDIAPLFLLSLATLVLFFTLANGLINYLLYRGLGVSLTFSEGIALAAVNTLANLLPFAGGMIAKGLYLKRKHNLSYSSYFSATLALYICFISTNGMIGIAGLSLLAHESRKVPPTLLITGFAAMTLSLLIIWLPFSFKSVPGKLGHRLEQLLCGWRVLSKQKAMISKVIAVQVLLTVLFAARFWIAFHLVSQTVKFTYCIIFSAATILTRLVSIAPGAFGIREAIVAAVASAFGIGFGVSVVAVTIDRLVATLVVLVLGTVYTYILGKKGLAPAMTS
jgi:uncharacterized membrane protein YbhN (UPF0104 family)